MQHTLKTGKTLRNIDRLPYASSFRVVLAQRSVLIQAFRALGST